jgi:hypothetical protein
MPLSIDGLITLNDRPMDIRPNFQRFPEVGFMKS